MRIRIEILEKKNIFQYAELLSAQAQRIALEDNSVTAVALVDDEDQEQAVGILQYCKGEEVIELTWIYVRSGYRNVAVGTKLLETLKEASQDTESVPIVVKISDYMLADMDKEEVCSFFLNRG